MRGASVPRHSRRKSLWASFSCSMCVQAAVVWLGVSYLHFLAMLPPDSVL